MKTPLTSYWRRKYLVPTGFIALFAIVGAVLLLFSRAATPYASIEAETGTATGVTTTTDNNASNHSYIQFGTASSGGGGGGGGGGGNSLCGFKSGTPAISKVMIIWEENEDLSSVIGNSGVPYMNQIATNCGYANNYWANTHWSLPNYMTMTSGVSYGNPWSNDCNPTDSGCSTSNASIFSQMGSNWKSYAESMPGNCDNSNSGNYAVRHNPAVYYTNISSQCNAQDIPLGSTTSGNLLNDINAGTLPAFTTVTPNIMDDWHNGTAQQADSWLKSWVPIIAAGSDYKNGKLAILVVFDEGSGSGNNVSHTYAAWLSANTTPGTSSSTYFDEYSVVKTVEDLLGQPELGNAKSATSMASPFNL